MGSAQDPRPRRLVRRRPRPFVRRTRSRGTTRPSRPPLRGDRRRRQGRRQSRAHRRFGAIRARRRQEAPRALGSREELDGRAHRRGADAAKVRAIYALFILALLTLSGRGPRCRSTSAGLLAPLGKVTPSGRRRRSRRAEDTSRRATSCPPRIEIGDLAAAFERMVAAVSRAQSRAVRPTSGSRPSGRWRRT